MLAKMASYFGEVKQEVAPASTCEQKTQSSGLMLRLKTTADENGVADQA